MAPSPITATSTADIWFHDPPGSYAIMIAAAAAPAENRICARPVAPMRISLTMGLLMAAMGVAAANDIPLPRPRPAEIAPAAEAPAAPQEPAGRPFRPLARPADFPPVAGAHGAGRMRRDRRGAARRRGDAESGTGHAHAGADASLQHGRGGRRLGARGGCRRSRGLGRAAQIHRELRFL